MGDNIHGLQKRSDVGLESQKMDPPLQTGFLRNAMQFIAVSAIVVRDLHRQPQDERQAASARPQ